MPKIYSRVCSHSIIDVLISSCIQFIYIEYELLIRRARGLSVRPAIASLVYLQSFLRKTPQ